VVVGANQILIDVHTLPQTCNQVEGRSSVIATAFEITGRRREAPFDLADIKDFRLRETGRLPAETIVENTHINLYSLDFEHSQAVFVETPPDVDLSQAPFYFITQYEKAKQVLTVSFEAMLQLAQSVTLDDSRLVFIHSVGRCGSTLASRIFAQIPGVINISEPDALTLLVKARHSGPDDKYNLIALLKATICLLCKTRAETAWVIKGRSYVIELGDWLHEIYPQTKNIFLYRHAETWLKSCLRAYSDGVERTDEEHRARENKIREFMAPMTPIIAQYDAKQHLSHASILALVWLSTMERYVQYSKMGIEMLAIRYANWRSAPCETAEAMLDYCQCRPTDMTAIYETLTRDSQAGTILSRETVKQHNRGINAIDLEALHRHLRNHAFIHQADFEVANTLKICNCSTMLRSHLSHPQKEE
jgi:hypothetical protein